MSEQWTVDVLGEPFQQQTVSLGEDSEGEVVATVVRLLPSVGGKLGRMLSAHTVLDFLPGHGPFSDIDVLYVHGWSDYFFQKRLARYWADRGANFYAIDLRKYGRSLREGQTPGYITDLTDYDAEISAALTIMGRKPDGTGERRLVLMGHSTGGLTLSLWAARHPDAVSALILNSPWLEFQLSGLTRAALAPVLGIHSQWRPLDVWPQVDAGFYSRAQLEVADPDDPFETDLAWRPERSNPVHVGWIRAVTEGHAAVAAGLDISAPICVLLSARTAIPRHWGEDLTSADTVLVVDDIARASLKLGPSVTVERIEGALHDVFLSRHDARELAYARLDRWATAMLSRH